MTKRPLDILLLTLLLLLTPSNAAFAGMRASFRFPLSNFSGPVPSQWAKLAVDLERNEIYALNQRGNDIRIFNENGMETFVFGDGYANAADIAIGHDGDIWILTTGYQSAAVHLLTYRGEHVAELELKNIPAKFSEFIADRLVYKNRSLYLVDSDALLVIVVDERGYFEAGHDLNAPVKPQITRENRKREIESTDWKKKQLEMIELNGFSVDNGGNMYFTIPVLFSAYRLSPQGHVSQFGRPGSAPGKFGVVAGIAVDGEGNVYVADRLRSVVLVFDRYFRFQGEFGYRGDRPANLIVPDDLAIDSNGNVYVGQAANRGVSVFKVKHEAVDPAQAGNDATSSRVKKKTRKSRAERKARTSRTAKKSRSSRVRKKSRAERAPKEASPAEVRGEASPAQGSEAPAPMREKPERAIRKKVSEPAEFVVDEGADTPSSDPDEPDWTLIESDHPEETEATGP
jgi:DNA-binding beta-propeller fold protein YncE